MNNRWLWKQRLGCLKTETYALYLASKDPRVPWYAKLVVFCVAAYVLSPIDLIPDFIPVLGYADDLIIVPLGIALAIKMIPAEVMEENRHKARETLLGNTRVTWVGATVIVFLWACFGVLLLRALARVMGPDSRSAVR